MLAKCAPPLRNELAVLLAAGALELPLPAGGETWGRLCALYRFGEQDLSLARLAEAHTDAIAILAEAGRSGIPGAHYGVWASDGPDSRVTAEVTDAGGASLSGTKRYCSGADIIDIALITAHEGDALQLFELPLNSAGVAIGEGGWATTAFAGTGTREIELNAVHLADTARVGGPNWYLTRAGFWHGALGPAACWAGGAAGLIEAALRLKRRDPHSRAQLGALKAMRWGNLAFLEHAAQEMDNDPSNAGAARERAYMVRHLIERSCIEIMDRFGRATGPQLLAFDGAVARRFSELTLYVRQCHAERDLEKLLEQA
jgi:alkylation response protein AidB-like acyl-CoA dehydrogenase